MPNTGSHCSQSSADSAGSAARTLVVLCADWPAVATARPAEKPLVVVHANRVISLNLGARRQGIAIGFTMREAQAHSPAVEVVQYDQQRDARAFELVLAAVEEFVPRVEVIEPGQCAFPTLGPSSYHGGDHALAQLVLARVQTAVLNTAVLNTAVLQESGFAHNRGATLACVVGVGIADGPQGAQIAAKESILRTGVLGTGVLQPMVVQPGKTAEFLSPLPIERLGVATDSTHSSKSAAEMFDVSRRLGIRTVGRFAALPIADVSARFGSLGMSAYRLATGFETTPLNLADPSVDFSVEAAIDPLAERVDQVAFVAVALAEQLHAELSGQGLACSRVLVVAQTDAGDRIERLWRHEGALSAADIARRVRWQLEGWLSTGRSLGRCSGGVERLQLIPEQVIADTGMQLGFWGEIHNATERAVQALARVQALLGADAVKLPELRGARSVSEQCQLVPIDAVDLFAKGRSSANQSPANSQNSASSQNPTSSQTAGMGPWPGRLPLPSPTVVWSEPVEAELVDAFGQSLGVSGRGVMSAVPVRCRVAGGQWHQIQYWAGPWCTEQRWWDAIGHRRRARVQVLFDTAAHLLTLEAGQWWLEATYD
ncbi:nucleotidyltransferase/DNA polymerase involved in DNA repair [Actinobacteria bacterium IMCC26207]|nr:nucleotidyltransferase/DNA polymerase involved in DNA repair [Actinobacteria bacterium IMCC26207]